MAETSTAELRRTPLHDFHVAAGARMVDFAGWSMPLVYSSIVEEHKQTRTAGSFFDVSHMGRLDFTGPDAARLLQKLVTRDLGKIHPYQSRYALVCNENGGIMDDVIVARHPSHWSMVCNASNREKLLAHFAGVREAGGFDATVTDRTLETAMVALQGPNVMGLLGELLPVDLGSIKRWGFVVEDYMMMPLHIYRSGYTGEDGVELVFPARAAGMLVKYLAERANQPDAPLKPAGLGARDTLRTEAALPLYGHELTEETDPISAGLGWAVSTERDFIGADRIRAVSEAGPATQLVGLELDSKRTARQGQNVVDADVPVGQVTSGVMSPTLGKSIAMAYVASQYAGVGQELGIDFKGRIERAVVVPLPFYKRSS